MASIWLKNTDVNVINLIMNLPFGDGVDPPFVVILRMVYDWSLAKSKRKIGDHSPKHGDKQP